MTFAGAAIMGYSSKNYFSSQSIASAEAAEASVPKFKDIEIPFAKELNDGEMKEL
jgi:hypothetical protein